MEKLIEKVFSYFIIFLVRFVIFWIVLVAAIIIFSGDHNIEAEKLEKAKSENISLEGQIAKLNSTLSKQKNVLASEGYISYVNRIKAEQKAAEEKAAAEKVAAEKKAAAAKAAADKKAAEEAAKKAEIEKAEAAKKEIADIKEHMNVWQGYPVCLAVTKVMETRSTSLHTANGNGTFVYVDVATLNDSGSTVYVNPHDFTLSTSTGYTVSHHEDTYSLSNYFNDVTLAPDQQTSGWLVFYITNDTRYTLNYHGSDGNATKEIMP